MRIAATLVVVMLGANVGSGQSPAASLTDTQVDAAIRAGQSRKFDHLISECVAMPGFKEGMAAGMAGGIQPIGAFDVIVSGAEGRVAFLAADAKRLYKPFSVETLDAKSRDTGVPADERMDGGAPAAAARRDSVVETVDAIDRTPKRGRQGARVSKRLQRR